MAKVKAGTRPLTAGGRTLAIKKHGGGGQGMAKRARVWFAAGLNKGEDKGKSQSRPQGHKW